MENSKIDQELSNQEAIIGRMASALVGKARTFSGGGGGGVWTMTQGEFTAPEDGSTVTVTHGLGKVPDIIFCRLASNAEDMTFGGSLQFSKAMFDSLPEIPEMGFGTFIVNYSPFGGAVIGNIDYGFDDPELLPNNGTTMWGLVRNAGSNTFDVGGGGVTTLASGRKYTWVAVAGVV